MQENGPRGRGAANQQRRDDEEVSGVLLRYHGEPEMKAVPVLISVLLSVPLWLN